MKRSSQNLKTIDVSVIIVNYNTKKATSDCIESCLKEGFKISKEIIVIDNASSDGSAMYLKEKFDGNIILIKNKQNLGFARAVNQGLKKSKGVYKYLLNSDTTVTKGTCEKLIRLAEKDRDIGVIGTKLVLPDGSVQKSCYFFPTTIGAIKEYWFRKNAAFSFFYTDKITQVDVVTGASFLITSVAYDKVGFFDERYFMYFEEIDYCKRIKKAGLKVVYFPDVIVYHYHGLSGKNGVGVNSQYEILKQSSIIYHGWFKYLLLTAVIWTGQKFQKLTGKKI